MNGSSVAGAAAPSRAALTKISGGGPLFLLALAGFLASTGLLAWKAPVSHGKEAFLVLYAASFLCFLACYCLFPESLPTWAQWTIVLGTSILARFFFIHTTPLDDLNRYIWDGYVFNHGWNPYLTYPDDPRLHELGEQLPEVWPGIKHRRATACYPPLATLLFSLGAWISPTLLFFKVLVLSLDIATIPVVGLILKARGLSLKRLILYSFNPLVLIFVAGEGHLDPIQGFFLMFALFLITSRKDRLGFLALGCAAMSKYFSLVAAPFLMNRANWRSALLIFLIPFLSYLPFWGTEARLFTSLGDFVTYYSFNDPLNWVFRQFMGDYSLVGLALVLAACLGVVFLLEHEPLRAVYLAMGSVLVCMPILNPWYLLWITPFLPVFPSRGWLYLHLAIVPASHMASLGLAPQSTPWILVEFVPLGGLLLWDTFFRRKSHSNSCFPSVKSLSVVIPVLNEQDSLGRCLQGLSSQPHISEVIVADGGSSDGTPKEAQMRGAKLVISQRGRGLQIKSGVRKARGDAVLVLHADCLLGDGIPARILEALNQNPQAWGGALGMSYEGGSLRLKALAALNNLRARLIGISFGDQGQFFRREPLEALGGFPQFMLMEDIELALRLRESGAVLFLPKGVKVSPRRWKKEPFLPSSLKIFWLVASFLAQRRLGLLDESCAGFYKRYYGKKGPNKPASFTISG